MTDSVKLAAVAVKLWNEAKREEGTSATNSAAEAKMTGTRHR
jgi:hypothetical protein